MGSIFSSQCSSSAPSVRPTTLADLPEGCAAVVMSYLGPEEVCRVARLNRAFRGASWADFVWESKLPENYAVLTEKVFDGLIENWGKREIYTRLCRATTFDGGSKRVWLDKRTRRVCLLISVKGLTVTGIDDRRYWKYIPTEESRFNTVAYVQRIWWFEIEGEVEFPFPTGTYSVFIRLLLGRTHKRFGRRLCNTEHVHGWDIKPVRFHLSTSDGQSTASKCFLTEPGKWLNYHVGDFTVLKCDSTKTTQVKFSVTQIDCTHKKGGLCLDSVMLYPREYKERLQHF